MGINFIFTKNEKKTSYFNCSNLLQKKKISLLIKKIEAHNINYYIKDNPLISDYEYDLLLRVITASPLWFSL